MKLTPYAEELIQRHTNPAPRLSGHWRDKLTGEKVYVKDDGNYVVAKWPDGYWHTFKTAEFRERFGKI